MMGEGKDGGGRLGPSPPHLNPPPPWGEELIFGSIGVEFKSISDQGGVSYFCCDPVREEGERGDP